MRELIQRECDITLSIRTVGYDLNHWGFTPQKPIKRTYEQRPKEVQVWVEEEHPVIKERAKKEKAEIHWGDETELRNTPSMDAVTLPKVKLLFRFCRPNGLIPISSPRLPIRGKVCFMGYHGSMNARVLIRFCRRLIKDNSKKIFLILDNLRVHHAKLFQAWLERYSDDIKVFYLPAYSPERNPDEYLNADLKVGIHSKSTPSYGR